MTTVIAGFVEVWNAIVTFLVGLFPQLLSLFWVAESGLTFVGVMAVVMAGIGLILLVFNLIRSFFAMHG